MGRRKEKGFDIILTNCVRNETTGCLEWQGALTSKGYGILWHKGGPVRTHRAAYELANNVSAKGHHVLHTCDVRNCCEPSHLFLGDNSQNIKDKMSRDRSGKKLTSKEVLEIKDLLRERVSQYHIADQYSINQSTVSNINTGKYWSHIREGI